MSFVTALALAVAVLAVAPYVAHRLRRRRAEEQDFPPAHLVPPAPPKARRRSRLEDRALFATRVVSVLLLALLGATPFVRCSRLSLQRSGGASIAMAIVLDDSMSMRAPVAGAASRFDEAREGARQLLASAREGDAVALVLAGAPARIALAATTDLSAVRRALAASVVTDRATDLDGALALGRGLVSSMPQIDRRVVVLSDMADGRTGPLGEGSTVPVWVADPSLQRALPDCAVVAADLAGSRTRVQIACGPEASAAGRAVIVEDAKGLEVGRATAGAGSLVELDVPVRPSVGAPVRSRLAGADAIASDDAAPVMREATRGAFALVADSAEESVATGGAPIVEQALSALRLDADVRPLPALPDRVDDLADVHGVLLDDPPGLTPEQRRVLSAFLERGGTVLLALGPRAAAAPLGATLEPVLQHGVFWSEGAPGADPATGGGELAATARSLVDLGARRRARLAAEDVSAVETLVAWTDGAPLIARRTVGRGLAWIVTLPFSVDASDLPLRPAFLNLLDAWGHDALDRGAPRRTEVGVPWVFKGAASVSAEGPTGALLPSREQGSPTLEPSWLGLYKVTVDGHGESRAVAPAVRELDLRPRPGSPSASGAGVGEDQTKVDASGEVALLVLAALALEMALRVASGRRAAQA